MVLGEELKDICGQRYQGDFYGNICSYMAAHGSKNALLVFMDLNDTNYKFMDSKIHFQSLWIYVFRVYGSQ